MRIYYKCGYCNLEYLEKDIEEITYGTLLPSIDCICKICFKIRELNKGRHWWQSILVPEEKEGEK